MNSFMALACGVAGGVLIFIGSLLQSRRDSRTIPTQRWLTLGFPLVAGPLATFGMQHLLSARLLVGIVPGWMPWRLFWVYFVGFALLAAALSFTFHRAMRIAAPLLALLFLILAVLIDLPAAAANPHQWIGWSMLLRELSYCAGGLAVTSSLYGATESPGSRWLFFSARSILIATVLYFGVEQLLFPQYSPGVPDLLATPAWVPAPRLITILTGVILVATGILLFRRRWVTVGALAGGGWMVLLTLAIYLPSMLMKFGTPRAIEGVDFVFDTLLFGGTLLLLGYAASPRSFATS
jgi:uncharacterized membrane protein